MPKLSTRALEHLKVPLRQCAGSWDAPLRRTCCGRGCPLSPLCTPPSAHCFLGPDRTHGCSQAIVPSTGAQQQLLRLLPTGLGNYLRMALQPGSLSNCPTALYLSQVLHLHWGFQVPISFPGFICPRYSPLNLLHMEYHLHSLFSEDLNGHMENINLKYVT